LTHRKDYHGIAVPRDRRKPRVLEAARVSQAAAGTEHELQEQAEAYCRLIGVESFHIPAVLLNYAFRHRSLGGGELWAVRQAAAAIKGFPDLIMFYRGRYAALEFKTRVGSVSRHQEEWIYRLDGVVCKSFESFKAYADAWKAKIDQITP
jgi:hypothetical protein